MIVALTAMAGSMWRQDLVGQTVQDETRAGRRGRVLAVELDLVLVAVPVQQSVLVRGVGERLVQTGHGREEVITVGLGPEAEGPQQVAIAMGVGGLGRVAMAVVVVDAAVAITSDRGQGVPVARRGRRRPDAALGQLIFISKLGDWALQAPVFERPSTHGDTPRDTGRLAISTLTH